MSRLPVLYSDETGLHRRSDPVASEFALSAGAVGGLMSGLAARGATSVGAGKAKAVILIFNDGAPSHIDLWDPKPEAASDIRSTYMPIPTNVGGIQITELLPRMAKRMDKIALVRSVHHGHQSHNAL